MPGETGEVESGWTVDTLLIFLQRQIDDLRTMLVERYATQTKAIDAAFIAQQTAMQTALTASEGAVQQAQQAANTAVSKAETATEKRFESVNEFRAQLAAQAGTFMPRELAETQFQQVNLTRDRLFSALDERIRFIESRIDRNVDLKQLAGRVDRSEGETAGTAATRSEARSSYGTVVATIAAGVSLIVAVVAVVALIVHG